MARIALTAPGRVRLTVHDVRGREMARLADGPLPAGSHAFTFNASALPVGLYLFRLRAAGTESARARVLAR